MTEIEQTEPRFLKRTSVRHNRSSNWPGNVSEQEACGKISFHFRASESIKDNESRTVRKRQMSKT